MKEDYDNINELIRDAKKEVEDVRARLRASPLFGCGKTSSTMGIGYEAAEQELVDVARVLKACQFSEDDGVKELLEEIRNCAEFPDDVLSNYGLDR